MSLLLFATILYALLSKFYVGHYVKGISQQMSRTILKPVLKQYTRIHFSVGFKFLRLEL